MYHYAINSFTEDVIPRLLTFTTSMHNHSVSYLPQLQPGVLADELDVGDPVDAGGSKAPEEEPLPTVVSSSPPHAVPVANNILAPTLRQLRRLKRLRRQVQGQVPVQQDVPLAHAAAVVEPVADAVAIESVPDPPRTPWQHNMTVCVATRLHRRRYCTPRTPPGGGSHGGQGHVACSTAGHLTRACNARLCAGRPAAVCDAPQPVAHAPHHVAHPTRRVC